MKKKYVVTPDEAGILFWLKKRREKVGKFVAESEKVPREWAHWSAREGELRFLIENIERGGHRE